MTAKRKTTENLFEYATRNKLRFPSPKGGEGLTVEQLWDAPLESRDGFDLNTIAKKINADVKVGGEENFVRKERRNTAQLVAATKLEIVKYVIAFREEEADKREDAAVRKAEKEKLMAALEKKQDAGVEKLTEAAIKKRLAELDADDE